jgi:hypothetical protein
MSLTISIRFLSGRAHLHHWQAHHSDGKIDWPPAPWRLLRALTAVAGRGLTTLPNPDFVFDPGKKLKATKKNPVSTCPPENYKALPNNWFGSEEPVDEIPLSQLASLLAALTPAPEIWLPTTSGGHTRQFFPIHEGGIVKNTGSAVFDTFAVISKEYPIFYYWPNVTLDDDQLCNLKQILHRLTYFGRAESWCEAMPHTAAPDNLDVIQGIQLGRTHWRCLCIKDGGKPEGQEHLDYILERKLVSLSLRENILNQEALSLFGDLKRPKKLEAKKQLKNTSIIDGLDLDAWPGRLELINSSKGQQLVARKLWTNDEIELCMQDIKSEEGKKFVKNLIQKCIKPDSEWNEWVEKFKRSPDSILLLRCLLRESGQDMKDGLERPIGTRWVHYAVPRAIYNLPRPSARKKIPREESIDMVRYALNTANIHRPVLPPLTDTLLVAEKFRNAILALHSSPSICLSGHQTNGDPNNDNDHAFYWPTDEDNDGFIDHVTVYCPRGFQPSEIKALRRLCRIRQRGGRPDLLITPLYVGKAKDFKPWQTKETTTFVSATPYFCPVHLTHGRNKSGKRRPIVPEIIKSLLIKKVISNDAEVKSIQEIVFDYAPSELRKINHALSQHEITEPVPPRQFFPVIASPDIFPPLPSNGKLNDRRFQGGFLKNPDDGFPFGMSIGILTNEGTKFVRAMSFCRQRRSHKAKGYGRIFYIEFNKPRSSNPFAIGDQCHFGLGLFVPVKP